MLNFSPYLGPRKEATTYQFHRIRDDCFVGVRVACQLASDTASQGPEAGFVLS